MNEILNNLEKISNLLAENEKFSIEDFTPISKLIAETEMKVIRLYEVNGSIGKSTKPILMDLTPEQIKEHGSGGCRLCIYEHTPMESSECCKCIKENTSNQYYL